MAAPEILPAEKQSEIVKAVKHLLALARSGRIMALGYAALHVGDDGDIYAGNNAVWSDNPQIREGLKDTISRLHQRVADTSPLIIQ
jgi:hypothetical protein